MDLDSKLRKYIQTHGGYLDIANRIFDDVAISLIKYLNPMTQLSCNIIIKSFARVMVIEYGNNKDPNKPNLMTEPELREYMHTAFIAHFPKEKKRVSSFSKAVTY